MNTSTKIPNSEEISADRPLDTMNADSSFQKGGTAIFERQASHVEVEHSPVDASRPHKKRLIPSKSRQRIIQTQDFPYLRIERVGEACKERESLTNIILPTDHDVLCGRGNFVNQHKGNIHFRSVIQKRFPLYAATPKPDKPMISELVYHEIRMLDPPGRFLREDPSTDLWHDIGTKNALNKIRQALRERSNAKKAAQRVQKMNKLSTGDNVQPQYQQINQSSSNPSHAQHQQKQSSLPIFEPQQCSQSSQSSVEIPNSQMGNVQSHLSSSLINAVASTPNGVPYDTNFLNTMLAISTENGGQAGNEYFVRSVASKIAAAHGVDTNRSLENAIISRLQSPGVAKCLGEKVRALLNQAPPRVDKSIGKPLSFGNTTGTKTRKLFPSNCTFPNKNQPTTETPASKPTCDVHASETTLNTPTLNINPDCSQTKTVTAANNVSIPNDIVPDITASSKVAGPDESRVDINVSEIILRSNRRKMRKILNNTMTSGKAQSQEILTNKFPTNVKDIRIATQASKRSRTNVNMIEHNKRCKTSTTDDFSLVKDSVAGLLAMCRGNNRDSQDVSLNGDYGNDSNSIDKTIPQNSITSLLNCNKIIGNAMQCDRCLGVGTLPVPPSALSNLQHTLIGNSTCGNSMLAGINIKYSSNDQSKNSLPIVKIEDDESKVSDISSNELDILFPDWSEILCNTEKKWGIEPDNSLPYYQRIEAIERKNLEHKDSLYCSNASSRVVREREKRYLEKVEDAEEKWGLLAPEGSNLVERVERVKDAILCYNIRLHNCL